MDNPVTGYALEGVYSAKLHFEGQSVTDDMPSGEEAQIAVGWDWRLVADHVFEVVLRVGVEPTKARPERAEAVIVGRFHVQGESQSVELLSFVKLGSVAILFPYAREAVSSLTSKGIFGSLLVNPVNIVELMKGFDQENTTAARQVRENSELAASWGLTKPAEMTPVAGGLQ